MPDIVASGVKGLLGASAQANNVPDQIWEPLYAVNDYLHGPYSTGQNMKLIGQVWNSSDGNQGQGLWNQFPNVFAFWGVFCPAIGYHNTAQSVDLLILANDAYNGKNKATWPPSSDTAKYATTDTIINSALKNRGCTPDNNPPPLSDASRQLLRDVFSKHNADDATKIVSCAVYTCQGKTSGNYVQDYNDTASLKTSIAGCEKDSGIGGPQVLPDLTQTAVRLGKGLLGGVLLIVGLLFGIKQISGVGVAGVPGKIGKLLK